MYRELTRVFHHELGHVIAHAIIYRNFGIHEVNAVIFEHHSISDDFIGKTIPKIPPGYIPTYKIENLAEVIAETIYGCITQALYQDTHFDLCFCETGNGVHDFDGINSALIMHQKAKKLGVILDFAKTHLEELKKLDLSLLTRLQPTSYLEEIEGEVLTFKCNLAELNKATDPIIEKIEPHFLNFLEQIRRVLTVEKLENNGEK